MVVALFPARIRQRLIAALPTWPAMLPRTSSLQGLADKCEVQLAYAIGVAEPVSVMINTFGTGKIPSNDIARIAQEEFDMRPRRLLKLSICCVRSTARLLLMVTSAANFPNSLGSALTASSP